MLLPSKTEPTSAAIVSPPQPTLLLSGLIGDLQRLYSIYKTIRRFAFHQSFAQLQTFVRCYYYSYCKDQLIFQEKPMLGAELYQQSCSDACLVKVHLKTLLHCSFLCLHKGHPYCPKAFFNSVTHLFQVLSILGAANNFILI